jgi:hypothetical protein
MNYSTSNESVFVTAGFATADQMAAIVRARRGLPLTGAHRAHIRAVVDRMQGILDGDRPAARAGAAARRRPMSADGLRQRLADHEAFVAAEQEKETAALRSEADYLRSRLDLWKLKRRQGMGAPVRR